ncbi:MAG: DnaJ domain-containing protein [Cyanobacteria bacterium P01_E01_bin.42]
MSNLDLDYNILELKPGASLEEIKLAYRKLAKIWHPDRFIDAPQYQQEATERFRQIKEAYERLRTNRVESKQDTKTTGIKTHSTDPEFYYNCGVENAEIEDYEEALADFSRAIHLKPDYLKAYQYRAFLNEKLGYGNRAKSDFEKVAELTRKSPQTQESEPSSFPSSPDTPVNSSTLNKEIWQRTNIIKKHRGKVNAIAIDPKGRFFVSGSSDKTIKLWTMRSNQLLRIFKGHSGEINDLALSPDGEILASASSDRTIKLWNCKQGKLICTFGGMFSGHSDVVSCVTFSRNGKTIASGSWDRTVKLWDLKTKKEINTLKGYGEKIYSLSLHPNGKTFASGGLETNVRLRQIQTGKLARSLKMNSAILTVAFSPDGTLLATGGYDCTIRLWPLRTKDEPLILLGHGDRISSLAFSPEGKILASGSWNGIIILWNVETGEKIVELKEDTADILSLAFHPRGKVLISSSANKTIRVWQSLRSMNNYQ